MSAHFASENQLDSDDIRTLLHDAHPYRRMLQQRIPRRWISETEWTNYIKEDLCDPRVAVRHPYRRMLQQRQLYQEPRRWISETEWKNYIKEDPRVAVRQSSVVSIFRVPKFLKDTNTEAYVPQRVSLGPLHHRSAELPPMGHYKGEALRRMMKRFNERNTDIGADNMDFANRAREEIMKLEKEIRDSYEENIDCSGEILASMLSLDGCFILEVLKTLYQREQCYHPIFGRNKLQFAERQILSDILMLENQVPLIVLKKLIKLEFNSAIHIENEKMLFDIIVKVTSILFNPFYNEEINIETKPDEEVHHLLSFLHTVIASPPSVSEGKCVDQGESRISIKCCTKQCLKMLPHKHKAGKVANIVPHATKLSNAGIKFKPCPGGISKIKFDRNSATILLPPISITDSTELVLGNLIAFEMCKPSEINYVSCYVALMDDLIDTQEDVALLAKMGIITNLIGSDQNVADLFNCLCKGVTVADQDGFPHLVEEVNAHYENKMKVQLAKLVRTHFSSPWKALGLLLAVVMLLLTGVQTICSIISVIN